MPSEYWHRRIFSDEEREELELSSEKIIYDSEHGIVLNIGLSNDMCVDLIEAWGKSHHGDLGAQLHMLHFIEGFVNYLKDYLNNEGIPFDDYE